MHRHPVHRPHPPRPPQFGSASYIGGGPLTTPAEAQSFPAPHGVADPGDLDRMRAQPLKFGAEMIDDHIAVTPNAGPSDRDPRARDLLPAAALAQLMCPGSRSLEGTS